MKLTTLQAEIALMNHFSFTQKLIVPCVTRMIDNRMTLMHECDLLILSKSNYATEVEIKVSASDLKADFKKDHNHKSNAIKYFYYAVPEGLIELALELIPEQAGLLKIKYCDRRKDFLVFEARKPKQNKEAAKWSEKSRLKLAELGTMRIYNLKKNILKANNGI